MVEATLLMVDPNVLVAGVRASGGKVTRVEPVTILTSKVGHSSSTSHQVRLSRKSPWRFRRPPGGYSYDRVDALVWASTDLLVEPLRRNGISEVSRQLSSRSSEPVVRHAAPRAFWGATRLSGKCPYFRFTAGRSYSLTLSAKDTGALM